MFLLVGAGTLWVTSRIEQGFLAGTRGSIATTVALALVPILALGTMSGSLESDSGSRLRGVSASLELGMAPAARHRFLFKVTEQRVTHLYSADLARGKVDELGHWPGVAYIAADPRSDFILVSAEDGTILLRGTAVVAQGPPLLIRFAEFVPRSGQPGIVVVTGTRIPGRFDETRELVDLTMLDRPRPLPTPGLEPAANLRDLGPITLGVLDDGSVLVTRQVAGLPSTLFALSLDGSARRLGEVRSVGGLALALEPSPHIFGLMYLGGQTRMMSMDLATGALNDEGQIWINGFAPRRAHSGYVYAADWRGPLVGHDAPTFRSVLSKGTLVLSTRNSWSPDDEFIAAEAVGDGYGLYVWAADGSEVFHATGVGLQLVGWNSP
jgi:hypothetical protein